MSKLSLSLPILRDGRFDDIMPHLDELRQGHSDVDICRALFEAFKQEFIQPNIFALVLTWSSSLDTTVLFIHHGPSLFVRKQGIRQFGKALADPKQWQSAWEAVGGTEGLIYHFAEVSVVEVKFFAKVIGNCNHGKRVTAREKAIEGLLHALLPSHYPDFKVQSRDSRPITRKYARMIPACSPEFVEQLLDEKDPSNPLYRQLPTKRLIKTHGGLLQKRIVDSLDGKGDMGHRVHQRFRDLVYVEPSRSSSDPVVSVSTAFATKEPQLRISDADTDKQWPSEISEVDGFLSIFDRSCLPKTELRDVTMLGLKLLEADPKRLPTFRSRRVWFKLIARWSREPELYDDAIVMALRLELGGSQLTIGEAFLESSNILKTTPELRWSLLRQYCLHVPKEGIDLDTSDDFSPLANQPWPIQVFFLLSKDQAVRLLNGLLRANQDYSFLHLDKSYETISILSNTNAITERNFNAVLLLTILQRDSEEIRTKSEHGVAQLRQESAATKSPKHRAELAKAASDYAIASGDLDLYSETVTWQRRYVRDPLTLKVIFGSDAVMSSEGIELLSGVPQPLPKDMTLVDVASRVGKANEILKTFSYIVCEANREQSFQGRSWISVCTDMTSLFGAAISQRVGRANELRKRGLDVDTEVYASIWNSTIDMLGEVSTKFRREAYGAIIILFGALPRTVLASIMKVMLEKGNEKRKNQDSLSGDDILERLSYAAFRQLVRSDMPELARSLVLQTIIDPPDASSWHRQFLSISFMNRLTAQDARQTILAFNTSISEKREEQSWDNVGEIVPSRSDLVPYLVKDTTVEYITELFGHGETISADLRAGFVSRILLPALRHSQVEHRKWLGLFLAKHNAAFTVDDLPPIPINPHVWKTLIERYSELIPRAVLEDFNQYVILNISPPAALTDFNKLLRENTDISRRSEVRHWLFVFQDKQVRDLFLIRMGFVLHEFDGTQTLLTLVHHSRPVPLIGNGITFEDVFDMVIAHALLFLDKYDDHRGTWYNFVNGLRPPTKATYPHTDADSIRSMALSWQETGRLVLEKVVELLVDQKKKLRQRLKQKPGVSILEKVAASVFNRGATQHSGDVLPSETKLLLWLLPYPCFPDAANIDQLCDSFVKKLVELLESLLADEADVSRWPEKIAEDAFTVSELLNSDNERLHMAFYVGDIVESSDGPADLRTSALNSVRVALAVKLIEDGRKLIEDGPESVMNDTRGPSSPHINRCLRQRIGQWRGCSDERIREQVAEWRRKENYLWNELMK